MLRFDFTFLYVLFSEIFYEDNEACFDDHYIHKLVNITHNRPYGERIQPQNLINGK